jgi:hypothetical protein
MADRPDRASAEPPEAHGGAVLLEGSTKVAASALTLTAYYKEPAPKLTDWIKAVRSAGEEFVATETEELLAQIEELDPDLRKTLALASVSNPPAPVRRWLGDATRHLLATRLKDVLIDPHAPAHEQIRQIATALAPGLRARDRRARAKSETVLRLAIRRVAGARPDFGAGEMLAVLFSPLRKQANTRLAPAELRRRIQRAGVGQLRDLSLVQAAAIDRLDSAERAKVEAQERASARAAALATERARVSELTERLAAAEARAGNLDAEVARLTQAIADNRQIGAHETAELLARSRATLAGRLDLLLADAADALEIDPPVLEVARDRIEAGRGVIRGEIKWLDDSSG